MFGWTSILTAGRARVPRRGREAASALELAILAPVFIMLLIGIVDFSFAFYSRLQLAAAIATGLEYAYTDGQNLTSSTVAAYLGDVGGVVRNSSSLTLNTATVLFNNASDNSNFGSCYCISNAGTWTKTNCGTSCSTNGPTAGKFVTITATYVYQPIFASPFLGAGTLSDSALARIQ